MCRRAVISVAICFNLSLSACVEKPFQPNPPEFTLWNKPGTSVIDLKKTMLECGFINPCTSFGMTENSYAKSELCMIGRGFINISRDGIMCAQKEYQRRLTACQSETPITNPVSRPH